MKRKIMSICIALTALLTLGLAGCGKTPEGPEITDADIPAGSRILKVSDYLDKVKAGFAGQMIGVSYAYPKEFASKSFTSYAALPNWRPDTILEGFNQDDLYLSVTAIEALDRYGLDVSGRMLGIDMYNRDFEYWNGSNNDVLANGYAPPYSGYPGSVTSRYPDGNSYMCGTSFAGLISPGMPANSNELAKRFAQLCGYGDGIYGAQFASAIYAESFFEKDIDKLIAAGLAAIPSDSWTALAVKDVIAWHKDGKEVSSAHGDFMDKYWYNEDYNWIDWPYGGRTGGINLDAKSCAAFITMGLLYGNGDFTESMKITTQCANDADSTAATTAGVIAASLGFKGIPSQYVSSFKMDQKFKYSTLDINGILRASEKLVKEEVKSNGGLVGVYKGEEVLVIPPAAMDVTPEAYQNSKTPGEMEKTMYTDAERAQMRRFKDPGFERHVGKTVYDMTTKLANDWKTESSSNTSVECGLTASAHTGIANVKITGSSGTQNVYNIADVEKNTNYEVSCYLKGSSNFPSEVSIFVRNVVKVTIREKKVSASGDWTLVTLTFNSGNNTSVQFGAGFSGGGAGDVLRIDDFTFLKQA